MRMALGPGTLPRVSRWTLKPLWLAGPAGLIGLGVFLAMYLVYMASPVPLGDSSVIVGVLATAAFGVEAVVLWLIAREPPMTSKR